ncbi:MAG TPA: hypothetical protein VM529_26015 [Gemmata sp.]|nr:hypothetical protein [Gemmata sp.]
MRGEKKKLAAAVAKLRAKAAARKLARTPLTILARQVSDGCDGRDAETRAPGVYDGGRTVVFRDEAERDRLVASVVPDDAPWRPLVIVAGRRRVEPPLEDPYAAADAG